MFQRFQTNSAYGWMMLAGIAVSIFFWSRLARRDDRLLMIYVTALVGAFLGAKLVYILAEGWMHFGAPDMWLQLATGKSILGALLGGYAAVELAKRVVGYRGVTGDWFALIAPLGIVLGRVGCLMHGCCLGKECEPAWFTLRDREGIARWPAVPVEIIFNLAAIAGFFFLRRKQRLVGQHFHLYLIAYGAFRFFHEFLRDTPRVAGAISGYQFAALAVMALGVAGFIRRRNQFASNDAVLNVPAG
ncbi:MAG TPA: prolipoprotein diacylglyceryl transferase family protein [Verrucomicrobiae bacterium]|jgi:phosphatidylglycerol:prolipoprotein diacylglycerol transferase|nr:prolipoprotein diacylglyceryl transferase family protein [Verrucomicrobiae bacterium]